MLTARNAEQTHCFGVVYRIKEGEGLDACRKHSDSAMKIPRTC